MTLLSWVAGALDAAGVFRLRVGRDGAVIGADVFVAGVSQDVARRLLDALGGAYDERRRVWVLTAQEQEKSVAKVLPFMHDKARVRKARRVLMFRSTQAPGRVSPEVRELRREIAEGRR